MLSSILTLAGLVLGVTVFLYFLSAVNGGKKPQQRTDEPQGVDPASIYKKRRSAAAGQPLPRVCPVCGSFLSKTEYLVAALGPDPGEGRKRQAQIYGCPHCYGDLSPGMTVLDAPGTNSQKEASKSS